MFACILASLLTRSTNTYINESRIGGSFCLFLVILSGCLFLFLFTSYLHVFFHVWRGGRRLHDTYGGNGGRALSANLINFNFGVSIQSI